MKLNETNRRRALQRRRKLMPEPRRVGTHEPTVLMEVPAEQREQGRPAADVTPIEQPPAEDPATAQT
jgi:hypothetical protein